MADAVLINPCRPWVGSRWRTPGSWRVRRAVPTAARRTPSPWHASLAGDVDLPCPDFRQPRPRSRGRWAGTAGPKALAVAVRPGRRSCPRPGSHRRRSPAATRPRVCSSDRPRRVAAQECYQCRPGATRRAGCPAGCEPGTQRRGSCPGWPRAPCPPRPPLHPLRLPPPSTPWTTKDPGQETAEQETAPTSREDVPAPVSLPPRRQNQETPPSNRPIPRVML